MTDNELSSFCKSLARVLISTLRCQTIDKALYNSCVQLVKPDVSDCLVGTLGKLSCACQCRASQIMICIFFKPLLRKSLEFYRRYNEAFFTFLIKKNALPVQLFFNLLFGHSFGRSPRYTLEHLLALSVVAAGRFNSV